MKKQQFKVGQNNISYLGDNFKEWFGDLKFQKGEAITTLKKLPRSMNDKEILDEIKPEEISLGDLYESLKSMDKSVWFLCYIKDVNGVLRAVRDRWNGDGWGVDASSVGLVNRWVVGYQILSRKFFDSEKSVDPLDISLFGRVKVLEEKMEKLQKFLILE